LEESVWPSQILIMSILITGGTGYIGSHCAAELLKNNAEVVLLDNLSNSSEEVCKHLYKVCGKKPNFYKGNINNKDILDYIFKCFDIKAVIHCAGLKAVGESVLKPIEYYENNVKGTKSLLSVMQKHDVFKLIFSSSASVYGNPDYHPIDEIHPLNPLNPYASSKVKIEEILKKLSKESSKWKVLSLRYFNPIGAHDSYLLGDDPTGQPNNLFPFIMKVAMGEREELEIFGSDYNTPDGTGIRDYIHIMDLVDGHISSMLYLEKMKAPLNYENINLGAGRGYSVLEVLNSFETVNNIKIPYSFAERREGDVDNSYANISKARLMLNWTPKRTIEDMCTSAWSFQKKSKHEI
jgi:UDP-glucose 4-epimerase